MTISVRQVSVDTTFDNPASLALASTPLQGSLLLAFAVERSGTTLWTMSSAGWTKRAERYQSPTDGTMRKSFATWSKVAGASEPTGITVTPTGGGGPISLGIAELTADAGEFASLTFGAGVASGSDTVAAFYDSGSTAAVSSTNKLLVGLCYTKVGGASELPYSDWTAGADDLTEFVEINGGTSMLDVSWAWALSSTTGTNSTRASKDVGSVSSERGAITSLLVFDLGGSGGATLNRSVGDTAAASDASTRAQTRARSVTDVAGANDTLARAAGRSRTLADVAAATDTSARSASRTRALSDSAPAADVTSTSSTGNLARSVADSAAAVDVSTRQQTRARALADTAAASDTSARVSSKSRALTDSAPTSDTSSAGTIGNLSRTISDSAPAADTLARLSSRTRSTSDAAAASDNTTARRQLARQLGDTAPATELSVQALQLARLLLDAALAADELAWSFTSGEAPIPVVVLASIAPRSVAASLQPRSATGTLKPRTVTAGVIA
jgi:hypothetical protein